MSILIKRLHYLISQRQGRVVSLATGCWQGSHAGEWLNMPSVTALVQQSCYSTCLRTFTASETHTYTWTLLYLCIQACQLKKTEVIGRRWAVVREARNRYAFNLTGQQHSVILFIFTLLLSVKTLVCAEEKTNNKNIYLLILLSITIATIKLAPWENLFPAVLSCPKKLSSYVSCIFIYCTPKSYIWWRRT